MEGGAKDIAPAAEGVGEDEERVATAQVEGREVLVGVAVQPKGEEATENGVGGGGGGGLRMMGVVGRWPREDRDAGASGSGHCEAE